MSGSRLAALVAALLAAGCDGARPSPHAQLDGPAALLVASPDGSSLIGRGLVVSGSTGELASGALPRVWRPRLRDDVIEVTNLPAGWREVMVEGVALVASGSTVSITAPSGPTATDWTFVGLYVLAAVYAVSMIGVSGGPNHGDHPLIMSTLLLGAVASVGQHWSRGSLVAALLVAGAAWVLSAASLRLVGEDRERLRGPRLLMATLWAGLLAIHLSEPPYRARAAWVSSTVFELYVPPTRRGPVEVLGADGAVVATSALTIGRDLRSLWVWTDEAAPLAVRLADGQEVPLGERPGR